MFLPFLLPSLCGYECGTVFWFLDVGVGGYEYEYGCEDENGDDSGHQHH